MILAVPESIRFHAISDKMFHLLRDKNRKPIDLLEEKVQTCCFKKDLVKDKKENPVARSPISQKMLHSGMEMLMLDLVRNWSKFSKNKRCLVAITKDQVRKAYLEKRKR